jgi:hypothetical protein
MVSAARKITDRLPTSKRKGGAAAVAFLKAKKKSYKKDKREKDRKEPERKGKPLRPVAVNFDGRSAQSMLRNAYRAQLDLLSLADTKASIMISITGLAASVLVASDMFGLGHSNNLLLPSGALLLTFLVALTFAVLAARPPRNTRRQGNAHSEISADSASVLHFANISRVSPEDYLDAFSQVVTSSQRTHHHMIVHLHELGTWLERKFKLLRISYSAFLGGLIVSGILFLTAGLDPSALLGSLQGTKFTAFKAVYEPSAVAQLPDGRLLILQDESHLPMGTLVPAGDSQFVEQPIWHQDQLGQAFKLSDLEGMTRKGDYIYAITSHAGKRSGARSETRERLVRFRVEGDRIVDLDIATGLKEAVLARQAALKPALESGNSKRDGFNIEGLSFDAAQQRLLVALRTPLMGDRAVVLAIENPDAIFDSGKAPRVGPDLIRLDLAGKGIRSLEYVPDLHGYLILAGNRGRSEEQWLWFWSGNESSRPRPATLGGRSRFLNGEGLTPARLDGEPWIAVVSDDGSTPDGRPGHYLIAPLSALEIDPAGG